MGRCDKLEVAGHESRAIHIARGLVWDFWGLPVVKGLMEPQGVRWKARAMLPNSQDLVQ